MRIAILGVLAFASGCGTSTDEPPGAGGVGGATAGASGSSTGGTAGAGGTAASGGAAAGAATGGKPTGGAGAGAVAGATTGGASAGSGGASGSSGSAGAPSAGSGSGCTKNLACKLNPPPSTGDLQQDCVDRINQFLTQCACLPALKRRTDGEACANQMAKYDADHNEAHAGAKANICQPGGSQNSCPEYGSNQQVVGLCMQQMWDEGPPPTPNCTGACYQEHGHFINMTDPEVKQVACGFYTASSGKVWAVQNFSR